MPRARQMLYKDIQYATVLSSQPLVPEAAPQRARAFGSLTEGHVSLRRGLTRMCVSRGPKTNKQTRKERAGPPINEQAGVPGINHGRERRSVVSQREDGPQSRKMLRWRQPAVCGRSPRGTPHSQPQIQCIPVLPVFCVGRGGAGREPGPTHETRPPEHPFRISISSSGENSACCGGPCCHRDRAVHLLPRSRPPESWAVHPQ